MAKDDMRLSLNFVDHPKVRKIIRRCGYEAFYGLIKLYSIAGRMYTDGLLKGFDLEDIEDLADWHGETGSFGSTLVDVGLIDETEEGFYLHDWEEHQPWIIGSEERSEKAKKAAEARWNKGEDSQNDAQNADSMQDACGEHASGNAVSMLNPCPSAPSPSPTPKNNIPPLDTKVSIPPKGKNHTKFFKPTVEEISAYCQERKNEVDPQKFWDFYESKGWKVGKNPMKDWKASVRTWEKSELPRGRASPGKTWRPEGYEFDSGGYDEL
ncbi:hypothetical protein [Pleomorphochaeta sp. DL1XJH-081]|uniref:hypothetical protein n=1 Tax=Pleomorphochaeta sp. DL1XJH-081 TaxID=3409690 RepID=UPI003BB5A285